MWLRERAEDEQLRLVLLTRGRAALAAAAHLRRNSTTDPAND